MGGAAKKGAGKLGGALKAGAGKAAHAGAKGASKLHVKEGAARAAHAASHAAHAAGSAGGTAVRKMHFGKRRGDDPFAGPISDLPLGAEDDD